MPLPSQEQSNRDTRTAQPTDKGCVSNVTSVEASSGDHEQLRESEKETGHLYTDVDIGEDINKVFITKLCILLHLVFQASKVQF